MGGRQAVRPRTLDPVSKVRILPAQPVFKKPVFRSRSGFFSFRSLVIFRKKIERFLVRGLEAIILPDRVRKYKTQNSAFFLQRLRFVKYYGPLREFENLYSGIYVADVCVLVRGDLGR